MKEYMLLVRNQRNAKNGFTTEKSQQFLNDCRIYIEALTKNGNLISAQPLVHDGIMVSGTTDAFQGGSFTDSAEVIVGYYHILANSLDEAVAIAQGNPEFAHTATARVEVRPIKMKEETTSYIYPSGQ